MEQAWKEAADTCLKCGAMDVFISATPERNEAIWSARGAFLEAIKGATTEMDECDVVVPRRNVAEFVMYSHDLQRKHDIRIRSFGHAGDGNLHIYILRDELDEKAGKANCRQFLTICIIKLRNSAVKFPENTVSVLPNAPIWRNPCRRRKKSSCAE